VESRRFRSPMCTQQLQEPSLQASGKSGVLDSRRRIQSEFGAAEDAGPGNGPRSAGADGGGAAAFGRVLRGPLGRFTGPVGRRLPLPGANSYRAKAIRPLGPPRRVIAADDAGAAFYHGLLDVKTSKCPSSEGPERLGGAEPWRRWTSGRRADKQRPDALRTDYDGRGRRRRVS